MQTKLSVTVDRNVDLCSPQQSVLSFVFFCSPMSLKLVITWVMTLLMGALVSCACLSFVFVVHSFFRVCIACTVCAAVRDYRARLLHTITVLFHTQTCQQGLSGQAAEAPFVSSQSSSETEVQHSVSIKSTVTGDTQTGCPARQQRLRLCRCMPRQNAVWSCQFCGWLWHSYNFLWKEGCTYDKARS